MGEQLKMDNGNFTNFFCRLEYVCRRCRKLPSAPRQVHPCEAIAYAPDPRDQPMYRKTLFTGAPENEVPAACPFAVQPTQMDARFWSIPGLDALAQSPGMLTPDEFRIWLLAKLQKRKQTGKAPRNPTRLPAGTRAPWRAWRILMHRDEGMEELFRHWYQSMDRLEREVKDMGVGEKCVLAMMIGIESITDEGRKREFQEALTWENLKKLAWMFAIVAAISAAYAVAGAAIAVLLTFYTSLERFAQFVGKAAAANSYDGLVEAGDVFCKWVYEINVQAALGVIFELAGIAVRAGTQGVKKVVARRNDTLKAQPSAGGVTKAKLEEAEYFAKLAKWAGWNLEHFVRWVRYCKDKSRCEIFRLTNGASRRMHPTDDAIAKEGFIKRLNTSADGFVHKPDIAKAQQVAAQGGNSTEVLKAKALLKDLEVLTTKYKYRFENDFLVDRYGRKVHGDHDAVASVKMDPKGGARRDHPDDLDSSMAHKADRAAFEKDLKAFNDAVGGGKRIRCHGEQNYWYVEVEIEPGKWAFPLDAEGRRYVWLDLKEGEKFIACDRGQLTQLENVGQLQDYCRARNIQWNFGRGFPPKELPVTNSESLRQFWFQHYDDIRMKCPRIPEAQ